MKRIKVIIIIIIILALEYNLKLNAEGNGETSVMENSSVSNNKRPFRDFNSFEQENSLEVRLHFRQDMIVTEHFNLSKSLNGLWSYSMCCPLTVVNCNDEILALNSSDYQFYSLGNDETCCEDKANQGWVNGVLNEYLLTPLSSFPEENYFAGIANDTSIRNNHSNLDECNMIEIENPSDLVAVRIKLHGLWIGRSNLILKLLLNSTVVASRKMAILVLPPHKKFGFMPTLGLFVGFSINIFGFALMLEKEEVLPFLKKPLELVSIAIAQYFIFPCLAWCINWIINPPLIFQFMLICTASASAGAITNLCSLLSRARLNLNVLSLLVTPLIGIVAVPAWVHAVGINLLTREFKGYKPIFPWLQFLGLKALFLMPVLLVFCVKVLIPSKARILSLIIRPIALVWVVSMLVLLAIDMIWTLEYAVNWRVSIGPIALLMAGGILLFPLSYVLTRNPKTSLTMTIQGIVANPSYGILLSLSMVPSPFTGIPMCVLIIYLISVISLAIIVSLTIRTWHCLFNKKADSIDTKTMKFTEMNDLETI